MRGVAVLIAYLLGLGAIISFGIAGLMALQTPSAPVATAPPTERVAKPGKQTTRKDAQSTQKDAQSNQKRKTVNTTRKRREEAPTTSPSGLDAFGYANDHRRFYSPFFWGR
jgi:hypothetical protein